MLTRVMMVLQVVHLSSFTSFVFCLSSIMEDLTICKLSFRQSQLLKIKQKLQITTIPSVVLLLTKASISIFKRFKTKIRLWHHNWSLPYI